MRTGKASVFTRVRVAIVTIPLLASAAWCSPALAQEEAPPPPQLDYLKVLLSLKLEWLNEKKAGEIKARDEAQKHATALKNAGGPQPGQTKEEYDTDVKQTAEKVKKADDAAKEDQNHIDELSKKDAFNPAADSEVAKRNGAYLKGNVDKWIRSWKKAIEQKEKAGGAAHEKEQVKRLEDAIREAAKSYPGVFPN